MALAKYYVKLVSWEKYRDKYSLNLLISSKLISDSGKEFNNLIVEVQRNLSKCQYRQKGSQNDDYDHE